MRGFLCFLIVFVTYGGIAALIVALIYSRLRLAWFLSFFIQCMPEDVAEDLAQDLLQLEIAAAYARYFRLMAKFGKTEINSTTGMSCSMSGHKMDMKYTSTTK